MIDHDRYTIEIDKLAKLREVGDRFAQASDQWIFRGQKNSGWRLQTTLERAVLRLGINNREKPERCDPDYDSKLHELNRRTLNEGLDGRSVSEIELCLLREFKRKCHQYSMDTPMGDNPLEWLALMRHFGAPSRLFDWTYSFLVALYFALDGADGECAVWALDTDWMLERTPAIVPQHVWEVFQNDENIMERRTFDTVFAREDPIPLVLAVNPYRLNARLIVQQGVFLCPGDVSKPFECNLEALLSGDFDAGEYFVKYVIKDDVGLRKDILRLLHRINMSAATLFPDLDGFARSLEMLLVVPGILKPDRPG